MSTTLEHPKFVEFALRFGDDAADQLLTDICEAFSSSQGKMQCGNVTFTDIHTHNACNHTLVGFIFYQGEEFHFIIDNGDWAGTVIQDFGTREDVGDYDPPEPSQFAFVPNDDDLKTSRPELWEVYLKWKKESWFIEKLQAYHYDRNVQPGIITERHYQDWAASKGMKIKAI